MKIKTSKLIKPALDWAIAKAKEWDTEFFFFEGDKHWKFPVVTTPLGRPELAIKIIEEEKIDTQWFKMRSSWFAVKHGHPSTGQYGPTQLIAAMRCYVASKLGNEVDIPQELL